MATLAWFKSQLPAGFIHVISDFCEFGKNGAYSAIPDPNPAKSVPFDCTIRVNIETADEAKRWKKCFEDSFNCRYIVSATYPKSTYHPKFSVDYGCHRSDKNKRVTSDDPKIIEKRRLMNEKRYNATGCKAQMKIRIKNDTPSIRHKDKFCARGLFGVVSLFHTHNHSLSTDTFRSRLTPRTSDKDSFISTSNEELTVQQALDKANDSDDDDHDDVNDDSGEGIVDVGGTDEGVTLIGEDNCVMEENTPLALFKSKLPAGFIHVISDFCEIGKNGAYSAIPDPNPAKSMPFHCTIRVNIKTADEAKRWKKSYEDSFNCRYIAYKTHPKSNRHPEFSADYVCHHSNKNKRIKSDDPKINTINRLKKRYKATGCKAQLKIRYIGVCEGLGIKNNTKSIRAKDKWCGVSGLFGVVSLFHTHNHNLSTDEITKKLAPKTSVKASMSSFKEERTVQQASDKYYVSKTATDQNHTPVNANEFCAKVDQTKATDCPIREKADLESFLHQIDSHFEFVGPEHFRHFRALPGGFARVENGFRAIIRWSLNPTETSGFDYKTAFRQWINKFSDFTKTSWVIGSGGDKGLKYMDSECFYCHLSIKKNLSNKKNETIRTWGCAAQIKFTVKKISEFTKQRSQHPLNVVIDINFRHSHELYSDSVLKTVPGQSQTILPLLPPGPSDGTTNTPKQQGLPCSSAAAHQQPTFMTAPQVQQGIPCSNAAEHQQPAFMTASQVQQGLPCSSAAEHQQPMCMTTPQTGHIVFGPDGRPLGLLVFPSSAVLTPVIIKHPHTQRDLMVEICDKKCVQNIGQDGLTEQMPPVDATTDECHSAIAKEEEPGEDDNMHTIPPTYQLQEAREIVPITSDAAVKIEVDLDADVPCSSNSYTPTPSPPPQTGTKRKASHILNAPIVVEYKRTCKTADVKQEADLVTVNVTLPQVKTEPSDEPTVTVSPDKQKQLKPPQQQKREYLGLAVARVMLMFPGRGFTLKSLTQLGPIWLQKYSNVKLAGVVEKMVRDGLLRSIGVISVDKHHHSPAYTKIDYGAIVANPKLQLAFGKYGCSLDAYKHSFKTGHDEKLQQLDAIIEKYSVLLKPLPLSS